MSLTKFADSNIKTRFVKELLQKSYVPVLNTLSDKSVYCVKNLLPDEYQEVEWIESYRVSQLRGAYIDTCVKADQNTGFDIKFIKRNTIGGGTSDYGCIFGAGKPSGTNEFQLTTLKQSGTNYKGTIRFSNNAYDANLINSDTSIQYASLRNMKYISPSGMSYSFNDDIFTTPVTIALFALNNNGSIVQYGNVRLYYLRLYNGDKILRDFIPCYRKSDNKIGLFDLVYKEFYTNNSDDGEIKKGEDVIYSTEISLSENSDYFYKDSIIKINEHKEESSTYIFPNDYDYSIIQKLDYNINEYFPGYTKYFINKSDYWDVEAHRYLGDYLRTLRDVYNLDLMPFYNCYDGETINNLYLSMSWKDDEDHSKGYDVNINEVEKEQDFTDRYRVFAVPIKFNTPYQIALQCVTNVLIAPVIWDDRQLKIAKNQNDPNRLTPYIDLLKNKYSRNISGMYFNKPYIFEGVSSEMEDVTITTNKLNENKSGFITYQLDKNTLYNLERHLYLLIQIPTTCVTSLSVIEGNYNFGACEKYINYSEVQENHNNLIDYYINNSYVSVPELFKVNDGTIYAFSDRLLEYLTLNTIDNQDKIEINILDTQRKLYEDEDKHTSIWNDELRMNLYNKYMSMSDNDLENIGLNRNDITGYVDKEIERYMRSKFFSSIPKENKVK